MAIFKEINCDHCGRKTGPLTRTKLSDGKHLCSKCTGPIPGSLKRKDYGGFLREWEAVEESKNVLSKQFTPTHTFHAIEIDTDHELIKLDWQPIIFKFENVSSFDMWFDPQEVKNGVFNPKVTGDIHAKIKFDLPEFFYESKIASNVKTKARKESGLFRDKAVYESPKGMDEFIMHFRRAWRAALDRKIAWDLVEAERLLEETNRLLSPDEDED